MRENYNIFKGDGKGNIKGIKNQNKRLTIQLEIPMYEILTGIPGVIEKVLVEAGRDAAIKLMEEEGEEKIGKKNRKDKNREGNWWGEQKGSIFLAGQRIEIKHPRLRGKDGHEIQLTTYKAFQNPDLIEYSVLTKTLHGISMRDYKEVVEDHEDGSGKEKSSVSRRFIAASKKQLKEFMSRPLGGTPICAVFIDGIDFKGHLLVVALGLDEKGNKHVLGLRQGATENSDVCMAMIEELIERGLKREKEYLFVLDGSKALRSAVIRVFGKNAAIQRCQQHKRRNVGKHLPPEHQEAIDARVRAAYNMLEYEEAKKSLLLTAEYLERLNPSAAASLREGLEETLTVHKLKIPAELRKTLATTNPIESVFSQVRQKTARVKRWRPGDMVQRWAVGAILKAEVKFRRVKGYRVIPTLVKSLKTKDLALQEVVA